MIKVFIIEDEIPAQMNLKRALKASFDDIEVVGSTDSVTGAVAWLSDNPDRADIVFMDVELSDGPCFEIFKHTEVRPKVIITTAYDNYAIKAFKVNSVDYLLKPIDHNELVDAVNKCRESPHDDSVLELSLMERDSSQEKTYKNRFAVKRGDRIIIVSVKDIAYVMSEEKTTWLVTRQGTRYIIDQSLDNISPVLDPKEFFRLSRAYLVSIDSIRSVSKHLNGRLKVILEPSTPEEIFVSRHRIQNFMRWLDGE